MQTTGMGMVMWGVIGVDAAGFVEGTGGVIAVCRVVIYERGRGSGV